MINNVIFIIQRMDCMYSELGTILLAFCEGFVLILSPCILPILPLFLASSLTGSKQRPVGLILGFIVLFALFVLFSRFIVQYLSINLDWIRNASYLLLLLFGLILTSDYLSNVFARLTQGLANTAGKQFSNQNINGGFTSGFLLGGLIAFVWAPCAGPILAAVLVQTVLQKTSLFSFIILLAFALGAGLPMLIIALYGRTVVNHFGFFKKHAATFRKIIGLTLILGVGYAAYQDQITTNLSPKNTVKTTTSLQNGLWRPYKSPEIQGIDAWINSPPLTIAQLKNKVVLVDFWTYSCINCLRTLPYIKDWYAKYHNKGLVIIGVHSPEFYFEKQPDNVKKAVQQQGIQYPVALDGQLATWISFNNQYWPAHYLIDKLGKVVYQHFGEEDYDVIENNIRFLLGLNDLNTSSESKDKLFKESISPETYLGYARANPQSSPQLVHNNITNYQFSTKLLLNSWALQGTWQVLADKIISSEPGAALKINFQARKVFIVMGSANQTAEVTITFNGQKLGLIKGRDVKNERIIVKEHRLYELISAPNVINGILEIKTRQPGLEIYTFTFGD